MNKIEIEKPVAEQAVKSETKVMNEKTEQRDVKKAVWQFRYKNYRTVLPYKDDQAPRTLSGQRVNAVVSARNYRVELDLTDPSQKQKHETLLNDKRLGVDFWLLDNSKRTEKVSDQGETLRKLMEMSEAQLRGVLTQEELSAAGLNPATATRFDIAMAVINSAKKRLVGRES